MIPNNGALKRIVGGLIVLIFGVFAGQALSNAQRLTAVEERVVAVCATMDRYVDEQKDNRKELREDIKELARQVDRLIETTNGLNKRGPG